MHAIPLVYQALLVLFLGLFASASPVLGGHVGERLTNAERFSRGLPPSTPRRRYDPDRVRARDASPSAIPSIHKVYLEVYNGATGAFMGYLVQPFETVPHPTITTDKYQGTVFEFTDPNNGDPFNILVNGDANGDQQRPYVAFGAASTSAAYLANSPGNFVSIDFSSRQTPVGSAPYPNQPGDHNTAGSAAVAGTETAIWTRNVITGLLGLAWRDPDGNLTPDVILEWDGTTMKAAYSPGSSHPATWVNIIVVDL